MTLREWFDPAADSYFRFTRALKEKDTEWLNYCLNDILLNVAGSFDTRKKVMPGHEPESFYHGLVLGLIVLKLFCCQQCFAPLANATGVK